MYDVASSPNKHDDQHSAIEEEEEAVFVMLIASTF
jgi:hypothetical protein